MNLIDSLDGLNYNDRVDKLDPARLEVVRRLMQKLAEQAKGIKFYCLGVRHGKHVMVEFGTENYRDLTTDEKRMFGLVQIIPDDQFERACAKVIPERAGLLRKLARVSNYAKQENCSKTTPNAN